MAAQQRRSTTFAGSTTRSDPITPWATKRPARSVGDAPRLSAGAAPGEYPGHLLVKEINASGTLRFQHRLLFIAHSLTHHHIRLEKTADRIWSI